MKKLSAIFFISMLIALSSCGDKNANTNANTDSDAIAPVQKGVAPKPDADVAVIDTEYGKIVIELYSNVAPKMVERFKSLIKDGTYNGVTFHRIDPNLGIIQGGDPLSKDSDPTNDGTGDSKLPDLPSEFSDIPYDAGIVGAARQGPPPGMPDTKKFWDTANCQFFITLKRQPAFDQRYTVFGKVIQGLNNANVIAGAPKAIGTERPDPPISIKSITLEPRSNYAK
jgi:cyclophilin family peptidyl-prolyl cis-trans isomerase